MLLELAQIVAELVEAVSFIGEVEGDQDGRVNFLRGPTDDLSAAMQQKTDDARVVDFEARTRDRADDDRPANALQQWKVDVDEAGGDPGEPSKRTWWMWIFFDELFCCRCRFVPLIASAMF